MSVFVSDTLLMSHFFHLKDPLPQRMIAVMASSLQYQRHCLSTTQEHITHTLFDKLNVILYVVWKIS